MDERSSNITNITRIWTNDLRLGRPRAIGLYMAYLLGIGIEKGLIGCSRLVNTLSRARSLTFALHFRLRARRQPLSETRSMLYMSRRLHQCQNCGHSIYFEMRLPPWARYSRANVHESLACMHTIMLATQRVRQRAPACVKSPRRNHRTADSVRGRTALVGRAGWVQGVFNGT